VALLIIVAMWLGLSFGVSLSHNIINPLLGRYLRRKGRTP
jgi:hypothetical protein